MTHSAESRHGPKQQNGINEGDKMDQVTARERRLQDALTRLLAALDEQWWHGIAPGKYHYSSNASEAMRDARALVDKDFVPTAQASNVGGITAEGIEQLKRDREADRQELERLRKALKPFAKGL